MACINFVTVRNKVREILNNSSESDKTKLYINTAQSVRQTLNLDSIPNDKIRILSMRWIKKSLEDEGLKMDIDEKEFLKISKPNTEIEENTNVVLGQIEPTKTDRNFNRTLTNWYQESIVKDKMFIDFNLNIIKNLFVDLENEKLVTDIVDGNINLQQYKTKLLTDLINYYNKYNQDKIKTHTLFDSDSNYYEVPKETLDKLDNYFKVQSERNLDIALEINPEFVEMYNKHFQFKFFDELLLNNFKNVLNISDSFIGKDVSGTSKYRLFHTDRDAKNWNDKEKTPDEVMNVVLEYILNSLKKYKFGKDTANKDEFLTKVDLNKSISTIKQIVGKQESKNIILKNYLDIWTKYKNILQTLGFDDNVSLYQLGNIAREHPVVIYPMLFDIFSNKYIRNATQGQFDGWDAIYSLNKQLFDFNSKSLFRVSVNNKNTKYLRQFIAQIDLTSPNVTSAVVSEFDNVVMKSLLTNSIDNITRNYKYNINGTLSEKMSDIGVDINWNTDTNTFTISKDGVFTAEYNPKSSTPIKIKFLQASRDTQFSELKQFYQNILGLDFNNQKFKSEIDDVYKIFNPNEDLLKLCIPMLAKHLFITNYRFTDNTTLEQDLARVFGSDAPKINFTSSKHIDFIGSSQIPMLTNFVRLYASATGQLQKSVYRTTDGNMISAQSITNGSTEAQMRWETLSKSQDSVAKHFSIYNLYDGQENFRELNVNGIYKKATRMTFNENLFTRFVYHFLNERANNRTKVLYGVTSDKEHVGVKTINFQFKPLTTDKSGNLKYEATDKSKLISELKEFYENVESQVNNNYQRLNEFLQYNNELRKRLSQKYDILEENLRINPLGYNSFFGLNTANNPVKLFREIIHEFNKISHIDVVNNVDYQIANGKLFENQLIQNFKIRYGNIRAYNEFIDLRNRQFYQDLINHDFSIQLYNETQKLINPAYRYLLWDSTGKWYNGLTGDLILGKVKIGDKWLNADTMNVNSNMEFKLHPALAEFNELQYLLSEQYNIATMGSYIFCDAKKANGSLDLSLQEKLKNSDYTKRNIDQSATVNQYQLNTLESIQSDINVAFIEDVYAPANTIGGIKDKVKPFDGATYVEAITNYLINSTSDKPENTTDKPLLTGFLPKSGSGLVIKTAGFANSNLNMRRSIWRQTQERKMLSRNFGEQNILLDYNGNKIEYGDIFVKSEDKYFKVNLKNSLGDNKYLVSFDECFENGEIKTKGIDTEVTINNCFDLYKLFGAWNSCSLVDNKLQLSEESIVKMVKAVNNVGHKMIDAPLLTQLHVEQPLKKSIINLLVTEGACKKGITNINPVERYTDNEPLDYTTIKAIQFGRQLDPTHEVDQAEVALMTQVMSGLSSSHSLELTNQVYLALAELCKLNNNESYNILKEAFITQNYDQFKDYFANFLIEKLSKDSKSTVIKTLLDPILKKYEQGQQIKFNDLKQYTSLDDVGTLPYISSLIASTLSNDSIKSNFTGTLSVLNPSYGIEKRYTGIVNGKIVTKRKLSDLTLEQLLVPKIENVNFFEFEHTYEYQRNIGTEEYPIFERKVITVQSLDDYLLLKQQNNVNEIFYEELPIDSYEDSNIYVLQDQNGNKIYKKIDSQVDETNLIKIGKIKLYGQDLASYNIFFNSGEKKYQIWDLDIVQEAYNNPNDIALRKRMQMLLRDLQNGKIDTVYIGENPVKIDKNSIKVQNYQTILPSVHMKQFGINLNDNVQEILDDPEFFYKRSLSNIISGLDNDYYQLALRNINGHHIYLTTADLANDSRYKKVEFDVERDGEDLYRLNQFNERVYKLSSLNDSVYEFNGHEIIVTKDFDFYLQNLDYNLVNKGSGFTENNIFENEYDSVNYVYKILEQYNSDDNNIIILEQEFNKLKSKITNKLKGRNINLQNEAPDLDKKLRKLSGQIHTSFKKSLEMLVARIPAQGMSSFMTMDVVDFSGDVNNNAYVNHMQIFLQGSDYDVDKATFMAYDIDDSGRFIGWSPYFSLANSNLLESSLKLPFPQQNKIVKLNPTTETFNMEKTVSLFESLKPYLDISSKKGVEKLDRIVELLNLNIGGDYNFNSDYFLKNHQEYVNLDGSLKKEYKSLLKIIEEHNQYLSKKLSKEKKESAFKNFITNGGCTISKAPENILRSQQGTDMASEELKRVADNTQIAKQISYYSQLPGNEAAKANDLTIVMSGKDGITVAASIGVKTYNALLNYTNNLIKQKQWNKLIKPVTIDGVEYGMLASADFDINEIPEVYKKYAILSQSVKDVRDTVSAFVSLAVDNAKELRLGLLNSDMNFMGMYLYAAYLGVPMETAAKILTSNTAQALSKVMTSDVYNGKLEIRNPEQAYKWIYTVPTFKPIGNDSKKSYEILLAENEKIGFNSISQIKRSAEYIAKAKNLSFLFKKQFQMFYKEVMYKERLKFIMAHDNVNIDGKSVNKIWQDIVKLHKGQQEIADLRNMLGLNQGINSDLTKALAFINRFETNYKLDFNKYIYDEQYKHEIIEKYEKNKVSWNPLDVIESIPNYREYLNTLNIYYNAMRTSSVYRTLSDAAYNDMKNIFRQVDESQIKTFQISVLRERANEWLRSRNIHMNIVKSNSRLDNGRLITFSKKHSLTLGDDVSNGLFIEYMNTKIIPDLKRGFLGSRTDSTLTNNKFVQYLLSTFVNKTPNKTGQSIFKLNVDVLPRTDYDEFELRRVIQDFYDLSNKSYLIEDKSYNLGDLFWYYNLIINNTQTNRNSLTPIFRKLIRYNETVQDYYSFIGQHENIDYQEATKRQFLIPSAPISSISVARQKGIKLFVMPNREKHRNEIMEGSFQENPETGERSLSYVPINKENTLSESFGFTLSFDARLQEFNPKYEVKGEKIIIKNVKYKDQNLGDIEMSPTISINKNGQKKMVIEYDQYMSALDKKYKEINPC